MIRGCLLQLQPLDPATGLKVDVFASSFATREGARMNGLNSKRWEPAMTALATIGMPLWEGDFGSTLTPAAAAFEVDLELLRNTWPSINTYHWAAAKAAIFAATSDDTWPLGIDFQGRVRSFDGEYPALKLRVEVDQEPFLLDVLTETYAGTGGAEGGTDLKNRVKPLILGWAKNVEPIPVDLVNNVYQFSGYGTIEGVTTLYERASAFGAAEGDYADYAALVAADLAPGEWATCLAEGMIRLGAPAYGVITGDVKGHEAPTSTPRLTGSVIATLADIAGVSSGLIESDTLFDLDTYAPYNINLVLTEQVTFYEIARRLALACNWQSGVSLTNTFFVSPVSLDGSPVITFHAQGGAEPQVLSVTEQYVSPPYAKTTMGADRSWRVHSADEIAQVNGFTGYLSAPTQSISADAIGGVADYSGLGGTFYVEVDGSPTLSGVTFAVASETGIDVSIDSSTGVYSVNDMSADDGTATFTATWEGQVFPLVYTVSKALAGNEATSFSIKGGGQFRYNPSGTIYSGQSIDLALSLVNFSNTSDVRLYRINSGGTETQVDAGTYLTGSGTVTDNTPDANTFRQTGTTITLTGANFNTAVSTGLGVIVRVTCGIFTDEVRILKVQDGAEGDPGADGPGGISAVVENESHTFPATSAGVVSDYTASGARIRVFQGVDALYYESGTGTPTDPQTYRIEASATGVTLGSFSGSGGLTATLANVTAVNSAVDAPYIDFTIRGRDFNGDSFTIFKRQSFSKSKTGAVGADAKTMRVTGTRQVIFYDSAGAASPSTQTNTFTALKQNTTATVTWTVTDADGTARTPTTSYLSAATGNTVTMTVAQFASARNGTSGVIVTGTLTDGTTITDSISVTRVQDGLPGDDGDPGAAAVSIVATKKAFALMAYQNGDVVSFTDANGRLYLYEDGVDVTASATLSATASGCTGTINTATNTPVGSQPKGYYRVTAVSQDVSTLTLTAVYGGVTYTEVITINRNYVGVEIVSSLPATNLFAGRIVFLDTDDKLYRYTGSAWTKEVPTTDLTGTITTTQITDDAITTPKIAANAITATEIATDAITANKILAGEITGAKLAATSIITLTAQINDAVITNAKISTLDAAKITTGTLVAARIDVDGVFNAAGSSTFTGNLQVTGETVFKGNGTNTIGTSMTAIVEIDCRSQSADAALNIRAGTSTPNAVSIFGDNSSSVLFPGNSATCYINNNSANPTIMARNQGSGPSAVFVGEVGIGTAAPDAAAALEISSTTQGLLLPRMTGTQRDAISSPPNGLLLYNSTTNKAQVRAGGAWVDLH